MTTNKEIVVRDVENSLATIEKKHGFVTAEAVVDEASKKTSPLHDYFEWDDNNAAHNFRLMQARWLIQSVKVEIQGEKTRAYKNVHIEIEDGVSKRAYIPTLKILSDDDLKAQIVSDALGRLKYWEQEYSKYNELKGILNKPKIEKLQKKYKMKD